MRVETFNRSQQGDLFGQARATAEPAAHAEPNAQADAGDPMDLMNNADTRVPPTMQ